MLLASTSWLLRVTTTTTANTDVSATYSDHQATAPEFVLGTQSTEIASATTTTIVAAPSGSYKRKVDAVVIRNTHASTANTYQLETYDGANAYRAWPIFTLEAGESMVFNGKTWTLVNADGIPQIPAVTNGSAVDVQIFDVTGTWVKPTDGVYTFAYIACTGGGGGGGGGAAHTGATRRLGGAGGGGGAFVRQIVQQAELGATETATIGAGGSGGAGGGPSAVGSDGTAGGTTTFGTTPIAIAYGGGAGMGGQITATAVQSGGGGGTGSAGGDGNGASGVAGYPGPNTDADDALGGQGGEGGTRHGPAEFGGGAGGDVTSGAVGLSGAGSLFGGGGGGCGGSVNTSGQQVQGRTGGQPGSYTDSTLNGDPFGDYGLSVSGIAPLPGRDGQDGTSIWRGGGGGGGGTSHTTDTGGAAGGEGGAAGGGGAGGGAGTDSASGAAGGAGGAGRIMVISW